MAGKSRSHNLPSYEMIGSAAARQNEGPDTTGVEFLRKGGCLDDDEPDENLNPLDSPFESMDEPTMSPEPPASAIGSPPAEPTPSPDPGATEGAPAATSPRRSKTRMNKSSRPATGETSGEVSVADGASASERRHRRKVRRIASRYELPPTTRGKTISCHFRLPEEVEQHLAALAGAHGCTRTHVVCAAIESAWKGLNRKKASPTSGADNPIEPHPSG